MSNNVLPDLPGVDIAREVEKSYRTTIHETVSGKEYRTSWGSAPRYRYKLRVNVARESVAAPAPWAGWNEVSVLFKFVDDHRGSFDSFLFNDPYDNTQRRVRFASDSLRAKQIAADMWQCEVELVSVI
jgi:hypothetical protein